MCSAKLPTTETIISKIRSSVQAVRLRERMNPLLFKLISEKKNLLKTRRGECQ